MQTSDALKALRAEIAPLHQDADPFVEYNQELGNLAIELGNLTSARTPTVAFRANGQDIVLSFAGAAGCSQFMVQADMVGPQPFPLRDAAEFVKLEAASRIAELATLLLDEANRANAEIRGATATITAVRDALKSV